MKDKPVRKKERLADVKKVKVTSLWKDFLFLEQFLFSNNVDRVNFVLGLYI